MESQNEVHSENYNVTLSMDSNNNSLELNDSRMSRTNLYSHDNMVVIGKNRTAIRDTRKYN